jgi:glycosyltransferase involved in cell wall biosynthesis
VWISIVIPALNEQEPIAEVVREVIGTGTAREVIVVDNGSMDQTAERARRAGARVVSAPRGYGRACAAGVAAVSRECDLIGKREAGSMNAQQIFAGYLAGFLIRKLYRVRYTDMSPFRAILRTSLVQLGMREETYGWNLEMQMKAARTGLRVLEIPVDHRCRKGGVSKVSGTLRGTLVASFRILATFFKIAFSRG